MAITHHRRPLGDPPPPIVAIKRVDRFMSLAGVLVARETRAARLAAEAAQLTRLKALASSSGMRGGRDFGPEIRNLRKEIITEDRADPSITDRVVKSRGGRVRDRLHTMRLQGHISAAQWWAVERLRDDVDLAGGCRDLAGDNGGVRGSAYTNRWPADCQLDAMARLRQAQASMAAELWVTTWWATIQGATLDAMAKVASCRRADMAGRLQDGLRALALFYNAVEIKTG